MGSHTLKQLKSYSFDEIKNMFEATMRRVHTFVPMESESERVIPELAAGSSKRDAEEELVQENTDDELWKLQKHIHDITWRLYDTCGVHHVSTKDGMDIYMLVEREYPLSRELNGIRYEPLHKGATFRLGGVKREMSLLELGWRVGLYSERESRDVTILSGLRKVETVNSTYVTHLFWPSIVDDRFNMGNTKTKSIRDPRIKLAHRCITMTITSRKETTNRVTEIDLFYLYCIFREGVICNIPYWLSKYLKGVRDMSVIFEGMFVTKIARSFGLLTEEMVSVLNRKPPPHVYRKKSLVKMGVIMELHNGKCCWLVTRWVVKEDEGNDEEGDGEWGNEGAGGSTDIYRNISARDLQVQQTRWMDQQDDQWGRLNTWMEQQDQRAHWMYDYTVHQFQHMSTRDNLEPQLQIDPFHGFEADYPPYGYHGHMHPGYTYCPDPLQDLFLNTLVIFDEKKLGSS
ncbi:hypothetical protein Tco_1235498 [Tanacetum coccineum]